MQRELHEMAGSFDLADSGDNVSVPRRVGPDGDDTMSPVGETRCAETISPQIWLSAPDLETSAVEPTTPLGLAEAASQYLAAPDAEDRRSGRGQRTRPTRGRFNLWASRTIFSAMGVGLIMLLHMALNGRDPTEDPGDKPWPDASVQENIGPNDSAPGPRVAEQIPSVYTGGFEAESAPGPPIDNVPGSNGPVYRTSLLESGRSDVWTAPPTEAEPSGYGPSPPGAAHLDGGIEHLPN